MIVGTGPQRAALAALAAELGLSQRIGFLGELQPGQIAPVLHRHRVMAVTTIAEEAFGIVALEGIACGCRMVVSQTGGLSEATGSLALTYPAGDEAALAACLDLALSPRDGSPSIEDCAAHLRQFDPGAIATRYLELFRSRI
jgi:glycosyltransferase involved in cell wall biosynthesis